MKKLALLLAAAAIAAPAAAAQPSTRGPVRSITYRTGACFGACPIYEVTVYSNGRATFTGHRFTTVTGTREFRVSPAAWRAFERHLAPVRPARGSISYSGENCQSTATDLPSATVTWHDPGREQELHFYYGCDMQKNRALAERLRRAPGLLPLGDFIGRRP